MHLTLDLIYYYKINKTSLLAILYTFPRVIQIYFPRVLCTLNAYNSLNTFPGTFELWEKTLYFFPSIRGIGEIAHKVSYG